MYILAIETTGAYASVAITDGSNILGRVEGNDRFSHLQNLMSQVEQVLKECELSLNDMTAIAVSVGPGSFTGIRIGVSSARALSQILGIPCVAVSSLEALALRGERFSDGAVICPMLDARRSQVYAGAYKIQDGEPIEVVKAAPYTLEEFLDALSEYENIYIMGDGADVYGDSINQLRQWGCHIAETEHRYQHASTVGIRGAKIYEKSGGVEYGKLEPEYMRIPEAERKLKEKQAKQEG